MVALIIKLFFINSINNQVVINNYFNNNTFDTLPVIIPCSIVVHVKP